MPIPVVPDDVATEDSGEPIIAQGVFDTVCSSLNSPVFESSVGARDSDIAFLAEWLNSNIMQSLVKAHDTLVETSLNPVSCDNIELLKDILDDLDSKEDRNPKAKELRDVLRNPHFMALMEAHDDIGAKNYDNQTDAYPVFSAPPQVFNVPPTDAIRMVGIRKNPEEPLGITVRSENGELVIARVLASSVVENQGLLHVGDVIKEINGQEVTEPDQLQEVMKKSSGSVTLKILPSYLNPNAFSQVYLKAHFPYDPRKDNLIPCRDAGLAFKEGDILQVVNMDDINWWQARKVDDNSPSGLIPSQSLEEKRKAFVKPEYDYTHKSLLCGIMTKKKKKMMYQSTHSSELDRHELLIYEEVARMPPFQRKTLVLVGAQGVGRRTLKQKLIKSDSHRFGSVIPHTCRPQRQGEVDGDGYWFVSREDIEDDINSNKFIEYGEFDTNYYGTKFDSIRSVIKSGKMCILDLNPQALKAIKTSEFMPFVVFVAAPPVEIMRNMHEFARKMGRTDRMKTERDFHTTLDESARIERNYKHYFDLTIVNDNVDEAYNKLRKAIETLSTEPQWVPVSWVY